MMRITPIVKNLLIINVAVFVIDMIMPFDLNNIMALRYIVAEQFAPYQFFTYMFAHASFGHIFFNMLGLFFLGPLLESFWGPKRFLTFYLVTGIGAAIIYMGIEFIELQPVQNRLNAYVEAPTPQEFDMILTKYASPEAYRQLSGLIDQYYDNPENPALEKRSVDWVRQLESDIDNALNRRTMVGASGAIYGLLMAIALLFPNVQFMLLFPPIPIKAKYLALILGGIALYSGLARQQGDVVAHFAHLGGMIFAFIMIKYWQKTGTYR